MPNCLLVAAGLPLMRRGELGAATVVPVVVVALVVGSTCSASGSFDLVLVLLLDEVPPPMPIAGDVPMPSLSEREPVPGAVLEHVRLALAFALIATRVDEGEDVAAEETEAPSLLWLAW